MTNVLSFFEGSTWAILPEKMAEIQQFAAKLKADDIRQHQQDHAANLQTRAEARASMTAYERMGIKVTPQGTAIVPIRGTISPRANMLMAISGGTSAEMIAGVSALLAKDDDVKAVVFDIDSPGGNTGGIADAAAAIRALGQVKPTASVANDVMASAAYWLGSAANTIYASPTAMVGSIGVMMTRIDDSKKARKEGRQFLITRSTPLKALGHPGEPVTTEERNDRQRVVDSMAELFVSEIATNLSITLSEAATLADGRVHIGQEAVNIGMANQMKTLAQVVAGFDADASAESRFEVLSTAYSELSAEYQSSLDEIQANHTSKVEAMQAQIDSLTERVNASDASELEAKVEEALTAAIETDQKIAPEQRDSLKARLTADFEGTMATLELLENGSAAPGSIEPDANASANKQEDGVPQTEQEAIDQGYPIARTDEAAEIFAEYETPFFDAR